MFVFSFGLPSSLLSFYAFPILSALFFTSSSCWGSQYYCTMVHFYTSVHFYHAIPFCAGRSILYFGSFLPYDSIMISDIRLHIIVYLLLWSLLFYMVLPLGFMVSNITYMVFNITSHDAYTFFYSSLYLLLYVAQLHYIFCHL